MSECPGSTNEYHTSRCILSARDRSLETHVVVEPVRAHAVLVPAAQCQALPGRHSAVVAEDHDQVWCGGRSDCEEPRGHDEVDVPACGAFERVPELGTKAETQSEQRAPILSARARRAAVRTLTP